MALIGNFLHENVGIEMLYRLQNEAIDFCLSFALKMQKTLILDHFLHFWSSNIGIYGCFSDCPHFVHVIVCLEEYK